MIQIEQLRELIEKDSIYVTRHMFDRLDERKISYNDVINSIMCGEIIEQYPSDYPYPSCLVLGAVNGSGYLHTVCGTDGEYLWIITAYYPDNDKWESDLKTRKEKKL